MKTDITATSGQTTFTGLTYTVGYVDVYLNGSKLSMSDYTATSGNSIVLTNGAVYGSSIEVIAWTISGINNNTGPTGPANVYAYLKTGFTATSGQTTFAGLTYTVGYVDVYENGVKLTSADYTATNGTSIVLSAGASAGSAIEVIAWTISGVGGNTGPTGSSSIIITDDTSTNATRYLTFVNSTTGALSSINTSSTNLFFNPNTGNFTAGGAITAYSDRRIKTNIQPITKSLNRLTQLTGVTYTRKDTGEDSRGLIAQDVQKLYPEMVVTNEQDGMMSIAYAQLMGDVVEAIKELNIKIETLEEEIQRLKYGTAQ